jgi:hypothetical protein
MGFHPPPDFKMNTRAPWLTRTAAGLRLCWAVAQLLTMAAVMLADLAWEHRQELRQAAVAAVAATITAAEFAYRAGQAARRWLEQLADASATLTAAMPACVAPVAPLAGPALATLETLRQALARLVARLYPELLQVVV